MQITLPLTLALWISALSSALVLPRAPSSPSLEALTDRLIFSTPLADFLVEKSNLVAASETTLDLTSDGCTSPLRDDGGFNFVDSCERHDFGYRNYKLQDRFSEENRAKIDDVFRKDLDNECAKRESVELLTCRGLAETYFVGVRRLGDVDTGVDSLGDVVDLIGDIFDKRAEEM